MAFNAQTTVTRPANATPYTAGDVVGGVIPFYGMSNAAGAILITSADLRIDVAAIPAGMTSFRLHLYSVTPPSALADHAVWDSRACCAHGYNFNRSVSVHRKPSEFSMEPNHACRRRVCGDSARRIKA
jgi:hypothetical protein